MAPVRTGLLASIRPWLRGVLALLAIWALLWRLEWTPVSSLVNQSLTIDATTTENENARTNLEFFVAHGLHNAADFMFIFNGETDTMNLLPNATNIQFVHRPNECYDMGAYASVLDKDDFYKQYKRFIMMNPSVRGPFIPYWSNGCWSNMYLSKVTDSVKLVGMTINCIPLIHIQTMILATDSIGIETLLFPSNSTLEGFWDSLPPYPYMELPANHPALNVPLISHPGINSCPNEYWQAVSVEVHASQLIKAAGYKIDAIMAAFHGSEKYEEEFNGNASSPDVLYENSYYGTNLHPFDTIFAKSNRGTNQIVLRRLTEWTDGRGYSSYDFCKL